MIQFNNQNDWKIVQYQGHDIKAAYSNLGKIWEKESPVPPTSDWKYKLTLNDYSIVSAQCDSTSSLTKAEIAVYTGNCISAVVGDCVTNIGERCFNFCRNLISVDIPNSVTSIGAYAFNYCTSLESVSLSKNLTSINDGLFFQCFELRSIDVPDSVTNIGGSAFFSCSGMTSITIGSGVTNLGYGIFNQCTSLSKLTINAVSPPIAQSGFLSDTKIASNKGYIYVPRESLDAYRHATNWSTYASRIQAIT